MTRNTGINVLGQKTQIKKERYDEGLHISSLHRKILMYRDKVVNKKRYPSCLDFLEGVLVCWLNCLILP